ncbi:MAG: 16S rRNA (guanine(527)-N(7))-methyltransferase RsmG [Acidimicrobiales bacterium]
MSPSPGDAQLLSALVEAQERGFFGPGPVVDHVVHARRLSSALPSVGLAVDLGSGGGAPGLVFALDHPGMDWVFVESQERRAAWLIEAIAWIGLPNVVVRRERVELTGRSDLRASAAVVTARSFAPPAVTAECGAPLLAPQGRMWVSEPPEPSPTRWPAEGLALLGLVSRAPEVRSWVALDLVEPCPDRYPRRVGIPAKRPLF